MKLNAKEIITKIENKREEIKKIGVTKIGLFGSFVKGKQKKNSDIDFLVEFDKKTFDAYATLYLLLEKLFKKKIDLVIEGDLKPELNYVKRETEYARI